MKTFTNHAPSKDSLRAEFWFKQFVKWARSESKAALSAKEFSMAMQYYHLGRRDAQIHAAKIIKQFLMPRQ